MDLKDIVNIQENRKLEALARATRLARVCADSNRASVFPKKSNKFIFKDIEKAVLDNAYQDREIDIYLEKLRLSVINNF